MNINRVVKYGFLVLFTVWIAVSIIGCAVQRMFVWPMSEEETVDRPVPPNAELVWIGDEKQRVEGWFFTAAGIDEGEQAPAVIFFHGNNEVMDHCLEFAEMYPKHGISVLLVEYRGYGRSDGAPGREAVRKDMIGFYDWLIGRNDVDRSKIVFHGRSIGGAVAADLSQHRKPSAMILTSTFTSMEYMFWRFGIPGVITEDKYRTDDVVKSADIPILVMHGKRDNIIPVSDGRELGSLGSDTTYIEYDANHDLPTDWAVFERDILGFLKKSNIAGGN